MAVKEILLLGNPKLYEISEPVHQLELDKIKPVIQDLHDTRWDFFNQYGAGRAIAAPQIGVMKRLIYMYIDKPIVFINPSLENKSARKMVVWDDCMSFPDLLVKVERHYSFTIRYRDQNWSEQQLNLHGDLSELLQHEYDHLDGILAVSKAMDEHSFSYRSQKELL